MLSHQVHHIHSSIRVPNLQRQTPRCRLPLARLHAASPNDPGGVGDDSMDVAVFRFTLGIPGFEDRLIPRVVAGLGASLMAINHILTPQPYPEAQGRAELLAALLAFVLAVVPEIEERLREARPGKGRQAVALIKGATNTFALDPRLNDKAKQELAWASFALLKNTNVCSVIVHSATEKRTLMARGQISNVGGTSEDTIARLSLDLSSLCSTSVGVSRALASSEGRLWLSDRGEMDKAGIASQSIPPGVESMLIQKIAGKNGQSSALLMLLCERSRALSSREQNWALQLAQKLSLYT